MTESENGANVHCRLQNGQNRNGEGKMAGFPSQPEKQKKKILLQGKQTMSGYWAKRNVLRNLEVAMLMVEKIKP